MNARLRARAAEALFMEPEFVYFSRGWTPDGDARTWVVGDGYRYKGGPYYVAGRPFGVGATQEAAVRDLERKVTALLAHGSAEELRAAMIDPARRERAARLKAMQP